MRYASRKIGRYMSFCPFTIRREAPLIEAHLMMRDHQIRHLPVLEGDKLAGVISERDLQLCELTRGVDPEQTRVEEVMIRDVYTAPPDALLSDVAHEMAAHKYGAAVVVDHGKVVGMFTSVDAMEALSTLLS